jgi:hypothetical protein
MHEVPDIDHRTPEYRNCPHMQSSSSGNNSETATVDGQICGSNCTAKIRSFWTKKSSKSAATIARKSPTISSITIKNAGISKSKDNSSKSLFKTASIKIKKLECSSPRKTSSNVIETTTIGSGMGIGGAATEGEEATGVKGGTEGTEATGEVEEDREGREVIGNLMVNVVAREETEVIEEVEAETVTTTIKAGTRKEASVQEETGETEKANKERSQSTSTRRQERLQPTSKTVRKRSSNKSKVNSLLFRTIYSY